MNRFFNYDGEWGVKGVGLDRKERKVGNYQRGVDLWVQIV